MGKKARTGKKAWRKSAVTSEVDEVVQCEAREERCGGALESASNEALFFVDTAGDATSERRVDRHRNKQLHCDLVLQRSSLVPPLPAPVKRKSKVNARKKPLPEAASKPVERLKKSPAFDVWADTGENRSKRKRVNKRAEELRSVPALEIDAPGCSYNPTFADHQDALGVAVAQEMQAVYKKELQPEPIPVKVEGEHVDEEDMFFVDAGNTSDAQDDEDNVDAATRVSKSVKFKKLTRAELNKKARRNLVLRQENEQQKKRKLDAELNRLSDIQQSIAAEEEERSKLLLRRSVAQQERQESCPPRLGKHKFKPERMQVLLTEEVTGSLRKLKGCYALLRDRYKSFQRRGILEPRVRIRKKASRKSWVEYVPGTKGHKEREAHAAMETERQLGSQALAVVPV